MNSVAFVLVAFGAVLVGLGLLAAVVVWVLQAMGVL